MEEALRRLEADAEAFFSLACGSVSGDALFGGSFQEEGTMERKQQLQRRVLQQIDALEKFLVGSGAMGWEIIPKGGVSSLKELQDNVKVAEAARERINQSLMLMQQEFSLEK